MGEQCRLAEKIVKDILEKLNDRRGIRQAFDDIDDDIRDDIYIASCEIVIFNLKYSEGLPMSNDNFEHIRRYYGVPARKGARVEYKGRPATVHGDRGHYHATWEMKWLDAE